MRIKQIAVFLENKPGHLRQICEELARAGINIVTLSLADTSEFGILRLIVREWEQARIVLEGSGHTVNMADVMAIEVADQPGGMEHILKITETNGLSVEYMYAFTIKRRENALLVIRFDDLDKAGNVLEKAGVQVLSPITFYDEELHSGI